MHLLEALLAVAVSVAAPQAAPQGPEPDHERAARTAAFRYERLLRRRAPARLGGGFGGRCDEVVGRFCFRFGDDTPDPPPEPEHPDIADARVVAVRAHRRWFSQSPESPEAARSLIRFLVDDGRAPEAVAAARTHVWAVAKADRERVRVAGDRPVREPPPDPESLMLLGLALHHAGDFVAAEAAFDSARSALPPPERRRLDDVERLLEPRERSVYADLSPAARAAYEKRLWAFSDPSLLVPGNERRSAHYARHAWTRILSEAPRVTGMLAWGKDHEEILLRYGLPTSRERIEAPLWKLHDDLSMVESFDPHAVTLVPPELLTRGLPPLSAPGVRAELERDTARSAYAPVRLHRMQGLELQGNTFPGARASVVRVDALLRPDTIAPGVPVAPRGLLAVLDTLGTELIRVDAPSTVRADSFTVAGAEVALPAGAFVVRIEIVDDSTGLAGLAQYRLDVPPLEGVVVSDLLMGRSRGDSLPVSREDIDPFPTSVLPLGQVVTVLAEVRGLERVEDAARYRVEWWLEPEESGSLLGRAARWVGRRLGLAGERQPVRVRWLDASTREPATVTFVVDLAGAESGLYRLGISVEDALSGATATATRVIRLDPTAPAPFAPAPGGAPPRAAPPG